MKCRWCAEWLDPSQRPATSHDAASPSVAAAAPKPAPAPAPAPIEPPARVDPPRTSEAPASGRFDVPAASPRVTAVDGSNRTTAVDTGPPPRAPEPSPPRTSWAPPAWMSERAEENSRAAASEPAPAARMEVATVQARTAVDAPPNGEPRTSLEDVALRMERIKASAAAIRQAIETEAQRVASAPPTAAPVTTPPPASAPRPVVVAQHVAPRGGVANEQPLGPATLHDDDEDELVEPAVVRPLGRSTSASGAFETNNDDFERGFLGPDDDFGDDDMGDPNSSSSRGDLGF
ncbi:MAG TPA: hypothetical protein VFG69_17215, partial [Nannocystaceae bacterium]|nr:hypothetical protein [Nannocystaceae bacterium]